MKSNIKWAAMAVTTAAAAAVLVACGGGSSEPPPVATANANIPASAGTAAAVANTTFSFGSVPALGTTGTTTFRIGGTTAAPTSTVVNNGMSSTSSLGFGSCILVIANSSFPSTHPMGAGKTVTINPCSIRIPVAGVAANGAANSLDVSLDLGGTVSFPVPIPVVISATGQITVNGTNIGVVTTGTTTGAL